MPQLPTLTSYTAVQNKKVLGTSIFKSHHIEICYLFEINDIVPIVTCYYSSTAVL